MSRDCDLGVRSMRTVTGSAGVIKFVWQHPANEGKRLRALGRAASFQVRARVLHRRTIARLGWRSRIWADLHRRAASKVVYANPPDYPEMLVWRRVLQPGDLFVDVGANVGSYSIWAAELGAEVIALEPAEDTFALLKENADLNRYPIRAIKAAAGSTCGTARFTSGRDTVNRLDPDGSEDTSMVTLDSIIEHRSVSGLKIDVEGFELEVLRGCERALADGRVGLMQLEWNQASEIAMGTDRQPVADLLARHGYSLLRPDQRGTLAPLTDAKCGCDVFARRLPPVGKTT